MQDNESQCGPKSQSDKFRDVTGEVAADISNTSIGRVFGKLDLRRKPDDATDGR